MCIVHSRWNISDGSRRVPENLTWPEAFGPTWTQPEPEKSFKTRPEPKKTQNPPKSRWVLILQKSPYFGEGMGFSEKNFLHISSYY